MDPITQGALGASLPQSCSRPKTIVFAGILGLLSGMAPDLDVFIKSATDPILFLEYHRQFTHSLIFIPLGGFICACVFHFLFCRWSSFSFKQTYFFCTAGYATHGLLDSCTSYGTQLLWPFSTYRFSWDTISIIDPILTLPLIILIITAAIRKQPRYAQIGLAWVIILQCVGLIQNHRASEAGFQIAQERGHQPIRLAAKPTLGNLLVWKVIYETESGFYSEGIRAGINITHYPGKLIPKLNIQRDFPWLDLDSQQAEDIERFSWFSQGYVAVDPNNPNIIMDARYSLIPNVSEGLWGIYLSREALPYEHVRYVTTRNITEKKKDTFFKMLKGTY